MATFIAVFWVLMNVFWILSIVKPSLARANKRLPLLGLAAASNILLVAVSTVILRSPNGQRTASPRPPSEPPASVDAGMNTDSAVTSSFPVVGKTYQLDRAWANNGPIVICTSRDIARTHALLLLQGDSVDAAQMIHPADTPAEIDQLRARGGCTTCSSRSRAVILQRDDFVSQGKFSAYPFGSMWARNEVFGAPID